MTEEPQGESLPASLADWIARTVGGRITGVDKVPGGASRLSFLIDHDGRLGDGKVFLRMEAGGGQLSGTDYNLAREARVLSALAGHDVAVAQVYGFNADHQAILMERVRGTTDLQAVERAEDRAALEAGLIRQLARLHALDVDLDTLFGPGAPRSRGEAVRAEIALWRDLYRERVPVPDPALDLALDWLQRTIPGGALPAVTVHGDIGSGNFMFDGPHIRALIDWELVHPGHPLEDLASVVARTIGAPFGTPKSLIAAYEDASGQPIDRAELAWCLVLVVTRFCIGMAGGLALAKPQMDIPMLLRFFQANRHSLLRLIARGMGLAPPPARVPALDLPASDETAFYDYAAAVITEQLGGGTRDAYLKHRAQGLAYLLTFLRDLSAYGSDRWRREQCEALADLVPEASNDLHAVRRAFAEAVPAFSDEQRKLAVQRLMALSDRQHALMRGALGPMFDRSIDLE